MENTNNNINDEEFYEYDGKEVIPREIKKNIRRIVVTEGISSIPDKAFKSCKSLIEIQLPSTIKAIGKSSFASCKNLKEISIPEGVTTIPEDAFQNCKSLVKIDLPSTVTTIGGGAFNECSKLKEIDLSENIIKSIGEGAFWNCFELEKISLPETITSIDSGAFWNCYMIQALTLPKVKKIGEYTFYQCRALRELILRNVETIDAYAIWDCHSLRSMELSQKTLKNIHKDNFVGCINLRSNDVVLPASLDGETRNHLIEILSENEKNPWSIKNKEKLRSNIYLKDGPGSDHEFKGKTQRGYGPEYWGITRDQLKVIRKHPMIERKDDGDGKYNFTMREFVDTEMIPLTDGLRMGYTLLINQGKPQLVKTMVSHAWDEAIIEFIDALLTLDDEGPYWICAFSIYQNYDESKGPTVPQQLSNDPEFGPFATVLRCVDTMVAVITFGCNIYTRLWCVFEMYFARKLGVNVSLAPYGGNISQGDMLNDVCIANIHEAVDSILARCGNPKFPMNDDEKMIRQAINHTMKKFAAINKAVEGIRMQYLVSFPTEKIESCQTYGRDHIKNAIETMIPRLPDKHNKLVEYQTYLQDQLASHPGFQEVEKLNNIQGRHDYYIINPENKDEMIDTFEGWVKFLESNLN